MYFFLQNRFYKYTYCTLFINFNCLYNIDLFKIMPYIICFGLLIIYFSNFKSYTSFIPLCSNNNENIMKTFCFKLVNNFIFLYYLFNCLKTIYN